MCFVVQTVTYIHFFFETVMYIHALPYTQSCTSLEKGFFTLLYPFWGIWLGFLGSFLGPVTLVWPTVSYKSLIS
jgi:hypothetical protein